MRDALEADLPRSLADNLDLMRRAHVEDDIAGHDALKMAFHDMLMHAANPKTWTIYHNLVRQMHLFRRRGLSMATNIARSIEEHEAILRAVTAGDPEAAQQAAELHIRAGLARYMSLVEAG